MPCTLEPWEIEYEEKRLNGEKFGQQVTDEALLEEVACQTLRYIEEFFGGVLPNDMPKLVVAWWKDHQKRDRKKGR